LASLRQTPVSSHGVESPESSLPATPLEPSQAMSQAVPDWLPAEYQAAVCFSIDDIHPAKSSDPYEAGGDLAEGALGHLEWLLERHPRLQATLFLTADWREISSVPTRKVIAAVPYLRDRVYLAKRWKKGTMSVDRHPEFVHYLQRLPRTEIALHGLHHCHKGPRIPIEFQDESYRQCVDKLLEMQATFERAGIEFVPGMCPPGWNAPPALLDAMIDCGLSFVASARDIFTLITEDATTNMSGMKGVSLIYPEWVHNHRLVHIPSNFHSTSTIDRAVAIIEKGGLLAIKAHIVKRAMGYTAYDGLDEIYRNYLDLLLTILEERYGDALWWTSMGAISERCFESVGQTCSTGAQ